MTVDRDLLWKAYPDGYLAMRGVLTVGGWQLWNPERGFWLQADGRTKSKLTAQYRKALADGDLLPNLDPSDTATWACALRDLAEAAAPNGVAAVCSITWLRRRRGWGPLRTWRLVIDGIAAKGAAPGIYDFQLGSIDDPATALATARAQRREAHEIRP